MFFMLKLVLIFLLNNTQAYITQDIERILLPALNTTKTKEIPLTLKVFGKQIKLNLRRNDKNVLSTYKVWKHDAKDITIGLSELHASDHCYYFHKNRISTAAINVCQKYGWEGFVFLKDDTLEIKTLRDNHASLSSLDNLCVKEEVNISFSKLHLIKRSSQLSADTSFPNLDNFVMKQRHVQNTQKKLTIELAVFLDETAYRTFMPFLGENTNVFRMLILAYVNRIQAVFYHPSLGVSIDISLVHLEIMKKQPLNLPVFGGDGKKLLNSFCNYAKTRNPPDDNNPHHWDVGLYLTGIDIYWTEQNDLSSIGLANRNSACSLTTSCAIVEFGIADQLNSGFSSSLTAAHEIGHVLGMKHDSNYINPCNAYKYIMASEQYPQGQMTWSECSRDIAQKLWYEKDCLRDQTRPKRLGDTSLDHSRYHNLPGRKWTAKAQCEIYFRDKDANVVSLLDICKTLECETPLKNGHYITGPALEGTYCAPGKECRGGECAPVIEPPYIFENCEDDNWSEWKESTCQSICLEKSKGVKYKRRSCKHGSRRTADCKGKYYDAVLCDDTLLCKLKRKQIDFTANKCRQFNSFAIIHNINLTFESKMKTEWHVAHDFQKPWKACSIHCRRKDSSTFYTPRWEMLSINIDPYFPDGTWCHKKDGQDYYCRQHYCLPASYS
ncbi:A disintegrin and metalloproteinase with thrombospondin motifs adt-2-like [Linepithema humile]|uniref:A disintegrin and metalloproteinase with thrombospondin motifs adt-2-like n=1 Tax=Linepithema humile TaxID=83485 RepID=UPI000623AA31|nr:PREDICTED: A disintegrin and metalloproteinase with thrombospondin motifs 4-like [Linepithema humile]